MYSRADSATHKKLSKLRVSSLIYWVEPIVLLIHLMPEITSICPSQATPKKKTFRYWYQMINFKWCKRVRFFVTMTKERTVKILGERSCKKASWKLSKTFWLCLVQCHVLSLWHLKWRADHGHFQAFVKLFGRYIQTYMTYMKIYIHIYIYTI